MPLPNPAAAPMTEAEFAEIIAADKGRVIDPFDPPCVTHRRKLIREVIRLRSEAARAKDGAAAGTDRPTVIEREIVRALASCHTSANWDAIPEASRGALGYDRRKHDPQKQLDGFIEAARAEIRRKAALRSSTSKSQPPAAGAELPTNAGIVDR